MSKDRSNLDTELEQLGEVFVLLIGVFVSLLARAVLALAVVIGLAALVWKML